MTLPRPAPTAGAQAPAHAPPPSAAEQLRLLGGAAAALIAGRTVAGVLERLRELACTVTGAGRADARAVATGEPLPDVVGAARRVLDLAEPLRLAQAAIDADPGFLTLAGEDAAKPTSGWLAVPLLGSAGDVVGIVEVCDKEGPPGGGFGEEDEALLVGLAAIASVALENTRVYERERRTASQLQRMLMPRRLPRVEGMRFAAEYLAGAAGTSVGGDWYDVIPLDDHRVGLVVGDVMGRGVEAASVMGQLRMAVRAYAVEDPAQPGAVLTSVNRLIHALGGEYFVTVTYAVWDLQPGTITFSSAGHLPPLLRLPDRTTAFLSGAHGTPIGVAEDEEYSEHRVAAPPGSTLVVYTDGLVERRDQNLGRTMGILARAAARGAEDADALLADLLASLPDIEGDDVAVLVAAQPGAPPDEPPHRDEVLELDPVPEAVARARRWTISRLRLRYVEDPAVDVAQLLVSELVTNAIVHASTRLHLAVEVRVDDVRLAVTDDDPQLPSLGAVDLEATSGRGMQLVDALADDWGTYVEPHGKTVWATVARRSSP